MQNTIRIEVSVHAVFHDALSMAGFTQEFVKLTDKYDLQPEPMKTVAAPATAALPAPANPVLPPVTATLPAETPAVDLVADKDRAAVEPATTGNPAAGEPKKRGRPSKAAAEDKPAAAPQLPKASTGGAAGVSTVPPKPAPTIEDLQAAFTNMTKALGSNSRDASAAVLLRFNAPRLRDLDVKHYAAAIDMLNQLAAGKLANEIGDYIPF